MTRRKEQPKRRRKPYPSKRKKSVTDSELEAKKQELINTLDNSYFTEDSLSMIESLAAMQARAQNGEITGFMAVVLEKTGDAFYYYSLEGSSKIKALGGLEALKLFIHEHVYAKTGYKPDEEI